MTVIGSLVRLAAISVAASKSSGTFSFANAANSADRSPLILCPSLFEPRPEAKKAATALCGRSRDFPAHYGKPVLNRSIRHRLCEVDKTGVIFCAGEIVG